MVNITEQLSDSDAVAEVLGLEDPSLNQSSEQRKVLMSSGVVFFKSRLLEELLNAADSRIDALDCFIFGNEVGGHVSNIPSVAIPKLTH